MIGFMALLAQATAAPPDFADATGKLFDYRKCVAEKSAEFAMKDLWREEVGIVMSVTMLACRHERTRYLDALEAAHAPRQAEMPEGGRTKVLMQFLDKIDGALVEECSRRIVKLRGVKGI